MAKKSGNKKKKCFKSSSGIEKAKINPFELRINRDRQVVLGRKSKHDRGMPGVSRKKAIKRRGEIFQKKRLLATKANSFIDKRIGENDDNVLNEDRIIARLVKERRRKYKKNIYNLNDEEELTHFGQPIGELETFPNPASDDDDDEEEAQLDADFVDKAHFGGFLTKKSDNEVSAKTHKEIIGDLILESKRKKQEKKVERELNEDLTEKLDKEWKELQSVITGMKNIKNRDDKPNIDAFDMTVRELKFEPRGTPSSRLVSQDEIEKAELKQQKKLEEERILRMQDSNEIKKQKFTSELSADSIYDGLQIENDFAPEAENSEENNDKSCDSSDESDNEQCNSSEDNYSDMESGDDDNYCNVEENENVNTSLCVSVEKSTIPFMYEDFLQFLNDHTITEVSQKFENALKNSTSKNKKQSQIELEKYFKVVLQYVEKSSEKQNIKLDALNVMIPHLYKIAQSNSLVTAECFREVLLRKIKTFQSQRSRAVKSNNFPGFDYLIILKLCSILYSTSDFRHPIVTPAMLLMNDILINPYLISFQNILSRLFITNLFLEYISYSKRYVPEAINFLHKCLYLACVKDSLSKNLFSKFTKAKRDLLLINSSETKEPFKINLKYLIHPDVCDISDNELKVAIIYNIVYQLHQYSMLYYTLPSFSEIFSTSLVLLDGLPVQYYPSVIQQLVKKFQAFIIENSKDKTFLIFPNKKPKPLKLYEPRIESDFDTKNQTISKKIKLEKQLSKKIKKEEKGVMREIRRDAQFMAAQQIKERMLADEERKRKVKQIYQELAMQEGEYKKMMKKK